MIMDRRRKIVAISMPRYGCHLVIYIHSLYRLHCDICGSVTSRRFLHTGFQRRPFSTLIPASSRAWFCEFSFCYLLPPYPRHAYASLGLLRP